MSFAIFHSSHI